MKLDGMHQPTHRTHESDSGKPSGSSNIRHRVTNPIEEEPAYDLNPSETPEPVPA